MLRVVAPVAVWGESVEAVSVLVGLLVAREACVGEPVGSAVRTSGVVTMAGR